MSTPKSSYMKLRLVYLLKLPLFIFSIVALYIIGLFVKIGIEGGPAGIVFIGIPYLFIIGLFCFAITYFLFLMGSKLHKALRTQYPTTKREEVEAALTVFILAAVIVVTVVLFYTLIWSKENDKLHDYKTVSVLENHVDAINNYGKLPESLSEVGEQYYEGQKPNNDDVRVQYLSKGSYYDLCTKFRTDTTREEVQYYPSQNANLNWHKEGLNCYSMRAPKQ